jgi:hypothetical protein
MPDISLCSGEGCPIKNTCNRFTAKPDDIAQSYFTGVPWNSKEEICLHFMPSFEPEAITLENAKKLAWGTHGKIGKDSLKWIELGDADTGHLEAIIMSQTHLNNMYRKAILLILKERYQQEALNTTK